MWQNSAAEKREGAETISSRSKPDFAVWQAAALERRQRAGRLPAQSKSLLLQALQLRCRVSADRKEAWEE
ncbi:MAG: hypothetical protein LKE44_00770 [Eubacterium sp.]|jgi:hypothetical protein|uniref:hypothetical protein n=1 Tax=Eubacterium sp. F2 TaxID=3381348 RepID=UPI0039081695|nr:hypothetical protein [Eubacterium sp.]